MWSTFVMTLKTNLRNKSALFWVIVFPLAVATLLNGMFGDLASGYEIKAVPLAVVQDANWKRAVGAQTFVNALSVTTTSNGAGLGAAGSDAAGSDAAGFDATGSDQSAGTESAGTDMRLVDATPVTSLDQARRTIAGATADGYLSVDGSGRIVLTVSDAIANGSTNASESASNTHITIAALGEAIDLYNRTDTLTRQLLDSNPQAATSRSFWMSLGDITGMTRETTLTNFKPDAMARYYYALLGMSCLMAMGYAISAVTTAQANLSALGIRRTVAPLSRPAQLIAGFLASWLCSGVSLLIALAYIRYVCGIALGGREPAAALAVMIGSFMACAFGTMIGAIPKLSHSVKAGLTSAIPCALSLFTGLYGGFAMSLSDWIARNAPVFGLINPAQQVTDLFYDILYYDGYGPFVATCARLLAMSAVFLIAAVVMLKEERYEHL